MESLETLEDRIRRTVELVDRLRAEKDAALRAAGESEALRTRVAELTREVETLRGERETVRTRLGKLLERLDALHAG